MLLNLNKLTFKPYEVVWWDLYRLIFLECTYCISSIGDIITWVNEWSALTKWFFKTMQCAFNFSNIGILR